MATIVAPITVSDMEKYWAILTADQLTIKLAKIGITAPMSVPVHRQEVYIAIKEENLAATEIDSNALAAAGELLAGETYSGGAK